MKSRKGLIFDIKRYALHDGPGIRCTIFFKGCPLRCQWCHNPESYLKSPQKMFTSQKCIGCQSCIEVCSQHGCFLNELGIQTNQDLCNGCGSCAEICPTEASQLSGRWETVENLMKEIEGQTTFFDQSGGGVTFSGGEPLMQAEFLLDLLAACERRDIHRTVDTSGFAKTETLLAVSRKTNLFLFDLKMMDSEKHRLYTGVPNDLIIKNLKILSETEVAIQIRVPLIKKINDDDDNLEHLAEFIASLSGPKKEIHLLPYHAIAEPKYNKLGQAYPSEHLAPPDDDRLAHAITLFEDVGLEATVGG